jgi:hypothetical protein
MAVAVCPTGTQAITGGFRRITAGAALRVVESDLFITDTGQNGWAVTMANEGATDATFHVLVRCATVS